ncbi:MAG: endonuclease/exonuclease/phosphatase family protein [Promethearchaeota archaeon]|nr:MAG: endonuclease/exonuclease/phosphatase family protein [Candidatus Lokiarchaeota archaeon]
MQLNKNLLKKIDSELILFSITFLFFIQLVGTLIESIYMLDLLNLSLDEKVAGVFFILSPFLLIIFRKKVPRIFPPLMVIILVIMRIITPLLSTTIKIITAGFGVACFLLFFSSYFSGKSSGNLSINLGTGFASAILLSIMFRAMNATIDISTYGWFQIIGWVLGALAILAVIPQLYEEKRSSVAPNQGSEINPEKTEPKESKRVRGVISLSLALTSIIILGYFALSSPTVISRWTNGSYIGIIISITVMIILSILVLTIKPEILNNLNRRIIWIWNLLFVVALVLTIAVHWFPFPATPSSEAVSITFPLAWYYYLPLAIMIGLLPIIFIDFTLLSREIINQRPSPTKLGISFGLSGLFFILVSLILIFTNVWGYVIAFFRNLFFLPFLLVGIAVAVPIVLVRKRSIDFKAIITSKNEKLVLGVFLVAILIGTITPVLVYEVGPISAPSEPDTLKLMTYNIQQGVDTEGEKAYDKQLAVIKSVDPDILGLQESDTARISGGNSDVVRYFASRLPGYYYTFYGPRTTTGTYGAAVLSKFPIISAETFFTYSDRDEIGTADVDILVGSTIFNVFINHPCCDDDPFLAHMEELMTRVNASTNVISMGDFNNEQTTIYYQMINETLKDTWLDKWPTGVDTENNINMTDRIDHIFVSPGFNVLDARCIPKNQSQSDHPAFWAEIENF